MLRALRNQTQSIFFKIFLFLLICGFALWGVGDLTGGQSSKSIINTEKHSVTLEKALNEINRLRYSYTSRPSLKEVFENGLHIGVLNKLEQEILLNSEAEKLNLHVPMSLITKNIAEENTFKDPLGKFSKVKFSQSLKNAGLSEKKYLNMINTEANLKQISFPFAINYYYNEAVVKKIMDWQNESRDIEFEIFKKVSKNTIKKPAISILNDYYTKNKNKYKIPKTRNIQYIEINPDIFKNQVNITQEQILSNYEINKSNYINEEKREILQVTTQDEKKANEFTELVKSQNFQTLAKEFFELSKDDINIGVLKKSELPIKNSNKLFKAKLNEVVGPLKTDFGFNIYKIVKIIPETSPSYDDILKDIKVKLTKEMSVELLFEKLEVVEDLIAEGSNISEIANSNIFDNKLKVNEVNKISENGLKYFYTEKKSLFNQPNIFIKNIWDTGIGEMSEIFNTKNDNYVLLNVLQENDNELPSFEKIKKLVYYQWLEEELIIQSKKKAKDVIISRNYVLSNKTSLDRDSKKIKDINDQYLINKIFDIKDDKIKYFVSKDNIVAVKFLNSKTKSYDFKKENYEDINLNLSKSFFNDYASFYIQNLSIKHKLKKNYGLLESFVTGAEQLNN